MKSSLFLVPLLSCFVVVQVSAADAFTPKMGDKARTAICDAVRQEIKSSAKFVMSYLRVQGEWAIFDGLPEGSDAGPIAAVLKRSGGKWSVVDFFAHGDIVLGAKFKKMAPGLPGGLATEYDAVTKNGVRKAPQDHR